MTRSSACRHGQSSMSVCVRQLLSTVATVVLSSNAPNAAAPPRRRLESSAHGFHSSHSVRHQ